MKGATLTRNYADYTHLSPGALCDLLSRTSPLPELHLETSLFAQTPSTVSVERTPKTVDL